jgi:hypothetical protein
MKQVIEIATDPVKRGIFFQVLSLIVDTYKYLKNKLTGKSIGSKDG